MTRGGKGADGTAKSWPWNTHDAILAWVWVVQIAFDIWFETCIREGKVDNLTQSQGSERSKTCRVRCFACFENLKAAGLPGLLRRKCASEKAKCILRGPVALPSLKCKVENQSIKQFSLYSCICAFDRRFPGPAAPRTTVFRAANGKVVEGTRRRSHPYWTAVQ